MKRPLSFCMVTTFFPPQNFGGDGEYVARLSTALARRGHAVTVVHSPGAYEALGGRRGLSAPVAPGIVMQPLHGRLGPFAPLATYLSGRPGLYRRELAALLEDGAFDVIHFHNVSLAGGAGVLELGRAAKLYTTHEHWLVCPMHVLWKDNREACEQPHCIRCSLAFRRPPQPWRWTGLRDRAAREVDLFLAPSQFAINMHRARGFHMPMRRLPLFVPDPDRTRDDLVGEAGRPYFLIVGRLERNKGVGGVIDLFRRYDAADLVIVGDGSLDRQLRRAAADLPHVRFVGRVPFERLPPFYAGATAVIAASVGYETFGLTPVEAFSQGTPAIVRDLGALPETVRESGAGYVFETDDELVEAMEALRTDPERRNRLGALGRGAYERLWSEDAHLDQYLEVVDAVVEARG